MYWCDLLGDCLLSSSFIGIYLLVSEQISNVWFYINDHYKLCIRIYNYTTMADSGPMKVSLEIAINT